MHLAAIVPGVLAALMLQGLFYLLKQQRDAVSNAVRYVELDHILSYRTIAEFVSLKRRGYVSFVLFRTVPVFLVMLPAVGYAQQSHPNGGSRWLVLIGFMFVNSVFAFSAAKRILPFVSVRATHVLLTLLTFLSALAVVALSYIPFVNLTVFSLSWDNLKNNLAAALIASTFAAMFFGATYPRDNASQRVVEQLEKHEFLEQQRDLIEYLYGDEISGVCSRFGLERALVHAVLLFENLNRPKVIRRLENALVRLPGITLTLGVAQVRSNTPLTDAESIIKMGQILWENINQTFAELPDKLSRFEAALTAYNGSPRYGAEVREIYEILTPSAE